MKVRLSDGLVTQRYRAAVTEVPLPRLFGYRDVVFSDFKIICVPQKVSAQQGKNSE